MIRPFRDEDADALAALLLEDDLPQALTGDGIRHWFARQPKRARVAGWVAETDGAPAGWVRARLLWATSAEGAGEIWAFVRPGARRRGLGAALFAPGFAHLLDAGARVLGSWTTDESGARFLSARGFRPERTQEVLTLDVAGADVTALADLQARLLPDGYELVPLGAVEDEESLYALDAGATADVPGTFAEDDVRLEDWRDEALGHPQLSREGSMVVLHGGEPVAYAFLHVAPAARAAANEMTGTRPDHRRMGLARLAKLGTIAWAREHGYETILTASDQDNAGMLHLNRALGYRPAATETQYLLEDLR
ncbi:MAG TPA: GNAT family N-acetyltransferase [Gaiellaceae bacterium]|nr:GNAT family N-acetyltransferase [Gaiellaceae bacterium]